MGKRLPSDIGTEPAFADAVKPIGDPNAFQVLYQDASKIITVCNVPYGCIVNTVTKQGDCMTEALCYVPDVHINTEKDTPRLMTNR